MNKYLSIVFTACFVLGAAYALYYVRADKRPTITIAVSGKNTAPQIKTTQPNLTTTQTQHLRLSHPIVTLHSEQQQLIANLTVEYRGIDRHKTGSLTVSGTPKLEEQSKRFYLQNPNINNLVIEGLDDSLKQAIHQAVKQYFSQYAVYAPFENNDSLQKQSLVYYW